MKSFNEFVSLIPRGHKLIKIVTHKNNELLISRNKKTGEIVFTYDTREMEKLPSETGDREAIKKGTQYLKKLGGTGKDAVFKRNYDGAYFK